MRIDLFSSKRHKKNPKKSQVKFERAGARACRRRLSRLYSIGKKMNNGSNSKDYVFY